jgi:hypothetical protein
MVQKGVISVKTANLYLIPMSDEDAKRTIGCATTCRPTLDPNIIYVAEKNIKLRLFYTHEQGANGCNNAHDQGANGCKRLR